MKKLVVTLACAFGVILCASRPAVASSFTLNQSNCCGSGPFGTITVTQFAVGVVDVLVDLNDNIGFILTGNGPPGNHPDLGWNLLGNPSGVSVSFVQTAGDGWTFYDTHASPVSMSDSYGTYGFAVYCNAGPICGPGGSDPNFGPLEFHVTLAGITPASFVANSDGTFFAADIINGYPNGATGLVRTTVADRQIQAVPEPASLLLLGVGLVGLRRKLIR